MSTHTPLSYAPPTPIDLRRLLMKWATVVLFLSAAALSPWWERPAWRRLQTLYWQHRCMVYAAPSDQTVFDSARSIHIVPKQWSSFYSIFSPPGFISQATIFMHEMKKPDGQKRLVVVDFAPWLLGGTVELSRVFQPASIWQRPKEFVTRENLQPGDVAITKIYAGCIDPVDISHFTFRAEAGNQEIIFDGWLQENETVIIGRRVPAMAMH